MSQAFLQDAAKYSGLTSRYSIISTWRLGCYGSVLRLAVHAVLQ